MSKRERERETECVRERERESVRENERRRSQSFDESCAEQLTFCPFTEHESKFQLQSIILIWKAGLMSVSKKFLTVTRPYPCDLWSTVTLVSTLRTNKCMGRNLSDKEVAH